MEDQLQLTADLLVQAMREIDPLTDYAEGDKQATKLGADMLSSLAGALVRVKSEQRQAGKTTAKNAPAIAPAPRIPRAI